MNIRNYNKPIPTLIPKLNRTGDEQGLGLDDNSSVGQSLAEGG
ncbi:MAG TPA: hypothetical protein VL380_09000 [Nitrosospira sp.]|jgi:hypothetical protein|nr:hypothetical protein [Nitrosospira sp.]